ncbi:MAG: RNA polymerase sigma-70 factor [Nocardioidaceae bacterium]
MPATSTGEAEFESYRPLMFSIAYRMLGSISDAEDVVQDAFLRYQDALRTGTVPSSVKAYLSAVVTRLAIDELRSARVRREEYVGQWLPEPLLTDTRGAGADPAGAAERADSLSMAFLLVLERLSPVQRAVFLLHDVFSYPFDEIAEIVGKSEANCRQLATRARRHLEADKPRFEASREARSALATRFFQAVTSGDVDGLLSLLATDVQVYGDGGGKAPQWSRVVVGADRVSRMLTGLGKQLAELELVVEPREVNGQPGALTRDPQGRVVNVWALDILDGRVQAIRSVINPDKLRHVGPVADAWALVHEGAERRRAARPKA